MAKVLVIRMSSFGDVAMLVPAVYSVASRYPQVRFVVMTRQAFAPLFNSLGFNVSVAPLELRKRHNGILGLFRMLGKATGKGFTHVADAHDVLRSQLIRSAMRLTFTKVAMIDKGREDKGLMTSQKDTSVFLEHTIQRYLDMFARLGFSAEMSFGNLFDFKPRVFENLRAVITEKTGSWIGIAPFAQHKGKIFPLQKMEQIVAELSQRANTTLFLFGAGEEELSIIKKWASKYPNIVRHDGKVNLEREILLISYLDVMLSMDSANMHLASLVRVPVVSVWGATHPALGFYGFEQDIDNAIQLDLTCRPCSVYGNTPCQFEGDEEYKCMKEIDNTTIISKIDKVLESKEQ